MGAPRLTVLDRINRFNAAYPWSHNDLYHGWVLRRLPDHLRRSVDIGCGTGALVLSMSARADSAEGVDSDPGVIDVARQRCATHPNVSFQVIDLLDLPGSGQYDAVTALASVHHLPLAAALTQLRSILAPGGTIVIVGCYRAVTVLDHLVDIIAIPANMIMGLWMSTHPREATAGISAPTSPAQSTLAEVREVAAEVLPGARIRRRLFWRYSLTYQAQTSCATVLA